ncbi:MAG: DHH family phosphoesterase [Paraclostridium sp.]
MKVKVFTHTDLDGIGSVVLLSVLLDAEVEYECHGYATIDSAVSGYFKDKKFLDYDMTLITDISIRKDFAVEAVSRMWNLGHKVGLLDHHPTAEFLNQKLWANVQTEKPNCGTSLTYEYIVRAFEEEIRNFDPAILKDVNKFVELVSQWDTWLWAETGNKTAKELNDLYYMYGREYFLENMITKLKEGDGLFDSSDVKALEIRQKQIDKYIETKAKQLMLVDNAYKSLTAGVVYAEDFISELGHELLAEFDEIDYVMMINMGQRTASLRAREEDNVDVEAIAASYGGGGHIKSAGFRFSTKIYDDTMMDIING